MDSSIGITLVIKDKNLQLAELGPEAKNGFIRVVDQIVNIWIDFNLPINCNVAFGMP